MYLGQAFGNQERGRWQHWESPQKLPGRDMQSGRSPSKEGTGPMRRLQGTAWPRGGVMRGLDKRGLSVADRPIFAPNPDDSGLGGEAGLAGHKDRGQNEATESTSP